MQISTEAFNRISSCNRVAYLHCNTDSIQLSALEEIGELSTEISIKNHWKNRQPSSDGILGECVDVFICLASIGLFEEPDFANELNHQLKMLFLLKSGEQYDLRINELDYIKRITNSVFDDGELPSITCMLTVDMFLRNGGTVETFLERLNNKITKWENNNVQSGH